MQAPSDWNEKELVRRCITGENAAWKEFLRRFDGLIRKTIRRTVRQQRFPLSREEEEEYYGAVLYAWVEHRYRPLRRFRWRSSLPTYVMSVSRRALVNVLRKEWVRSVGRTEEEPAEQPAPDTESDPSESLPRRELHERLRWAFSRLSPEEQKILRLAGQEEKTYREIADILQISRMGVSRLLHQARETLSRFLRSHLCL